MGKTEAINVQNGPIRLSGRSMAVVIDLKSVGKVPVEVIKRSDD